MNHLGWIKPDNDAMRQAIKRIEKGQSDENVFEIYETFKDNPKIKWKERSRKWSGYPRWKGREWMQKRTTRMTERWHFFASEER